MEAGNDKYLNEIYRRNPQTSLKYQDSTEGPYKQSVDAEKMIPIGMADMQFPFPDLLVQKLRQQLEKSHFGYPLIPPNVKQVLYDWLKRRHDLDVEDQWFVDWPNSTTIWNTIIGQFTNEGDEVLLIEPFYEFLHKLILIYSRKPVCCTSKVKDHRYDLNLEEIQKTIQNNNIKIVFITSPLNPTGRIFKREQLEKLVEVLCKYDFLVVVDQIFSDAVPKGQFTSMLSFKKLHHRMIVSSSHTKSFNCSGLGAGWTFSPNPEIRKKLAFWQYYTGSQATTLSYAVMKICYLHGEDVLDQLHNRFQQNHRLFKELCSQKIPKLQIWDLECSYLMVVDFKNYSDNPQEIKKKIFGVSVCPCELDKWHANQTPITLMRFNIAIHPSLIPEIVNRLASVFEEK